MNAFRQERRMGGPGTLALALLLLMPSVVAFFSSSSIMHEANFPVSALWFVYEISLYLGCAGVAIVVALTISAAIAHRISRVFVWLMAVSVVCGASLLWYSSHIYRNPWMTNR